MGRIAVVAGGSTVASLLPASLLQAGEVCAAVAVPRHADPCGDWMLDDICNAYPPYAFDIRRGTVREPVLDAQVAAADHNWVA